MEESEINPEEESALFRSEANIIKSKVGVDRGITAKCRKSTSKVVECGKKDSAKAAMKVVDQFMHGGIGFHSCKIKVP